MGVLKSEKVKRIARVVHCCIREKQDTKKLVTEPSECSLSSKSLPFPQHMSHCVDLRVEPLMVWISTKLNLYNFQSVIL